MTAQPAHLSGQPLMDSLHGAVHAVPLQIRRARDASGRSVANVCERLGIPESTYLDIESGEWELSLGELQEVLYAVDAELSITIHPADQRSQQ